MIQPSELQIKDYVRNLNKLPEALVNSILSQVDVMEEIEAQEAEVEIHNTAYYLKITVLSKYIILCLTCRPFSTIVTCCISRKSARYKYF
ncbi:hypothetical protein BpHYR1_038562 [Brachionus plicatilis]|uniref:Uncharacterized protein n=1 Tax=Brachionus plicatilis TaxID=10195 RepID=A0A3M7PLA8_BRAPC|nr:hypothetical protein BpHYR1_038562 [Brachionus plicatilis]